MLAVQDFTRLGSRAFVCSEVYKVYSYYDFGKDIKNNDKNKIKYFFCFLGKWGSKKRGALDKPQIAIRIDGFVRCKSRIGDKAFYAVPCGIRFKLGVFSVAQIIQEAVYLTNVI